MKLKRRLCCLVLTALLTLSLAIPIQAAKYTDLPATHWAYAEMDRAASLGIIAGVGGGAMAPSATLTWAQYLTMLAHAFAAEDYLAALDKGIPWDQAGYQVSLKHGILLSREFLPVREDDLHQPISRQDVAVLLNRVLPDGAEDYAYYWLYDDSTAQDSLSDFYAMDQNHREAVARLYQACVTRGKDDGSFGMYDTIQRSDGAFMLIKVLELVDRMNYGQTQTVTLHFQDLEGRTLLPDQTAKCYVGQYLSSLATQYEDQIGSYRYDSATTTISSACYEYTITFRPMSDLEIQVAAFWDKVERGEATYADFWKQDFCLKLSGDNPRKRVLLFGNEDQSRFASQAEAEANMVTVTVPVWKISNGKKVSSTATFSIHAALAQDVKEIFTEIYNDPEQFPIHSLGGYSWRGDSATGEHNCGTAIDINPNENYQVQNGTAMVGTLWDPDSNPYSIPADGSVVRIFAEHGWTWGGDAWAWSTDPDEGYHDYMHFSYLGG